MVAIALQDFAPDIDRKDFASLFQSIMLERNLSAVYQPIMDLRNRRSHGFEALIRGPAGGPLESPQRLFACARQCDRVGEFDRLCVQTAVEDFAAAGLPGHLFLNVTEGVLVTEDGHYRGLLLVGDLLRLVTEFQVQAARYANPLTLLPGNVPINDCLDRWLREERSFAAAYADIDHFKPFNDKFGYRMGDEVILMLAELKRAAKRMDGPALFIDRRRHG